MVLISNSPTSGKKLASKLHARFYALSGGRYPDTEQILQVRNFSQKADVIHFQFNNTDSFDDQLFNLFCVLEKFSNPKKTKLVLPYLPYSRAATPAPYEVDKLFFLLREVKRYARSLYVVAPHAGFSRLRKQVNMGHVRVVDIDAVMRKYIKSAGKNSVLVSPDQGFAPDVKRLAKKCMVPSIMFSKKRISPLKVITHLNSSARRMVAMRKGGTFILIDDIVSTGTTLVDAASHLKNLGVKKIKYIAVHNTCRDPQAMKVTVLCSNSLLGLPSKRIKTFDISESIASALKK